MIDLYFAPTPNGWKASIMLEECGLDYAPKLVRLSEGEQFSDNFLKISPNAKIPAIVDYSPAPEWGNHRYLYSSLLLYCFIWLIKRSSSPLPQATCGRAKSSWNGCFGRLAIRVRWADNLATFETMPLKITATTALNGILANMIATWRFWKVRTGYWPNIQSPIC